MPICLPGEREPRLKRCVLIRAQFLVEIGYLQVFLCIRNHVQHDRPAAVNTRLNAVKEASAAAGKFQLLCPSRYSESP